MMDKRGAELSMNVVIIAIIGVLVLVVVALVFTSNVATTTQKMREFLGLGTSGQSIEFVKDQCRLACENAKLSDTPKDSRYCKNLFDVKEGDSVKQYSCWNRAGYSGVGVGCPGVDDKCVS